jgi:hypothetical protein
MESPLFTNSVANLDGKIQTAGEDCHSDPFKARLATAVKRGHVKPRPEELALHAELPALLTCSPNSAEKCI